MENNGFIAKDECMVSRTVSEKVRSIVELEVRYTHILHLYSIFVTGERLAGEARNPVRV
jgi:hypothetical protein